MKEDQIIAEAEALAFAELPMNQDPNNYAIQHRRSAIRHALRLATQPEQDPALVKAMAVAEEAREAYWACTDGWDASRETAARVIMKHYGKQAEPKFDIRVGNMKMDHTVGLSELLRLVRGGAKFHSITRQEISNDSVRSNDARITALEAESERMKATIIQMGENAASAAKEYAAAIMETRNAV